MNQKSCADNPPVIGNCVKELKKIEGNKKLKGGYMNGGFEYPTDDVFSGIRVKASAGNLLFGTYLLYGLDKT